MFSTILSALLPVVLTLLLGYLAGRYHDFTSDQATVLNRLKLLSTLPADLLRRHGVRPLCLGDFGAVDHIRGDSQSGYLNG